MIILDTVKLVEIYVKVDDFMLEFSPLLAERLLGNEDQWKGKMSKSEMMAILIYFHFSGVRCFAWYYNEVVKKHLSDYCPYTYSYQNFVSMQSRCNLELYAFLLSFMSEPTKANYIDSKPLEVCHIKREKQNKVFKYIAGKGKSSKSYFYGLKLHLIINQQGKIVNFVLTSGNVADNNHEILKTIFKGFKGDVYGDKSYISKLKTVLEADGCELITKPRKNMKKAKLSMEEQYYLKKEDSLKLSSC